MKFLRDIGLVLGMSLWLSGPAMAQEASESIQSVCRQFADSVARTIKDAQRYKVDPATRVRRVSESWLEGVQNHMLLAAARAEYLTESELALTGYSYCIERRPTDRR